MMDDHILKLYNRYSHAMNRWEMAFTANNGNTSKLERELSRKAHWAYGEWRQAEQEAIELVEG